MPVDIRLWPKHVRYGVGAVMTLNQILADFGLRRALVVCGRTVSAGEMLMRVRDGLRAAFVGCFDKVEGHTPLSLVREAADLATAQNCDVVVSVGGGSAIDCGKGIAI